MKDSERLSPGARLHLIWATREGEASPEDAKQLLADFVTCMYDGDPLPRELLDFLRDAFCDFLMGRMTLEAALGLKRKKRGNPGADEQRAIAIATEVWRWRLAGQSHQGALEEAGERRGCGTTKAGKAWKAHKQDGLVMLRLERALNQLPWTPSELDRIEEIVRDDPQFTARPKVR